MRKQVFGRHLKRDTNERKALFKGLASSLVMHERIETTEEKAKAIKGHVEKLVTKAKKNNSINAKRLLQAYLTHDALQKMLTDVAPRFVDRPGGYTRILKIGSRFSDNASMAIIEWVDKTSRVVEQKAAAASSASPKATKKKPSTKKKETK